MVWMWDRNLLCAFMDRKIVLVVSLQNASVYYKFQCFQIITLVKIGRQLMLSPYGCSHCSAMLASLFLARDLRAFFSLCSVGCSSDCPIPLERLIWRRYSAPHSGEQATACHRKVVSPRRKLWQAGYSLPHTRQVIIAVAIMSPDSLRQHPRSWPQR